ncbi:neutral zinc metallopeptidase [Neisseria sp. ZJ106]|uniref:Zinc metallopeptidase n=1 Tax=Neisseria lisongii TaxID=2912188 RepID=A0AAW5AEP6_9NEIS|nr:neutral zinc metallopeptidase [Neisseria lisongii]MCF7521818.1 neutral zinc metallopeptidase [Neisseria lisongii]MCF7529469.1 neutral zinc metallopeptidase [Neisseria lisongii]MCF7530176.1 neutral zinc metallopeptidase [Neisseria lisongii]WCL72419.1 zinc metallopeptidase [Neisseria lisongii]
MDWQGRRQSSNVEDRRGASGGGGGKTPGILGIIVLLVGAYYGVDLSGIVGTPSLGTSVSQQSTLDPQQENQLNELARVVLADTEATWSEYFARDGRQYTPTTMVLYTGGTQTACGMGQAAMGPFYCPGDRKVYLDLSFYEDMRTKLKSASDAAFAYVIAHEVGHHIQNLLGILPKVNQMQQRASKSEANALSVKLELQADCFAGVWGHFAVGKKLFEAGDIEKAMLAAESVGDDRLQHEAQGYVVPDSFTHGSSADRMKWLQTGLQSGDINQCNTFR